MTINKPLVFFFLFLVAMVIFPSFAAFICGMISGFVQFVCLLLVINLVIRLIAFAVYAAYNVFSGKEASEGVYSYK